MARFEIPEPLPLDFEMVPVERAHVTARVLDDGTFEQVVEHPAMPGVTPAKVLWFLERVDRQIEHRGVRTLAYRLWHPRDHIHFRREKKELGPGDTWHIVEAFQARRDRMMEGRFHVTRIDESGFEMEIRRLGTVVARMEEQWTPHPDGMRWRVRQHISSTKPVIGAISRFARERSMPLLRAWPRHNVEEGGCLPQFLPELYDAHH